MTTHVFIFTGSAGTSFKNGERGKTGSTWMSEILY